MQGPPLNELYQLLRAEGFAIGIDDHLRIGRLLAFGAAWTPELLRTAVAALVMTDPGEQDAFEACWARWMSSAETPLLVPMEGPDAAMERAPVAEAVRRAAPEDLVAEPERHAAQEEHAVSAKIDRVPESVAVAEAPSSARRADPLGRVPRGHLSRYVAAGVMTIVAAVFIVWYRVDSDGSTNGFVNPETAASAGASHVASGSTGPVGPQAHWSGSGTSSLDADLGSDMKPGAMVADASMPSAVGSASKPPSSTSVGSGAQQISTGSAGNKPSSGIGTGTGAQQAGTGSAATSVAELERAPEGHTVEAGSWSSLLTSLHVMTLTVALGAMLLAVATVATVLTKRAQWRFLPGPWRYVLAVPPAVRPILPRAAIEDAAADLTWQASGSYHELDLPRSIAATIESGGLATLVHCRLDVAPRYVVLEDTAVGATAWQPIYDELLRGLTREGVEIERYTFAASPAQCQGRNGHTIALAELADHADALLVIGSGNTAVDLLDGSRAAWLETLRHVPRRLWINPVPPARWGAGAHAIAEHTPMVHGVARAAAALRVEGDRLERPARPYPAVIDRAPHSASGIVALRAALGEPAFQLVSAVAMAAPPTVEAARWLAEVLAIDLDEQDWLAISALPWFGGDQWPDGLRERLRSALGAEAPAVARTVGTISDDRFAASEPPRDSAAHLAWQLEGADRAAARGNCATAVRTLDRIAASPLAHRVSGLRAALGLPDRQRRLRALLVAAGVALVVGPLVYRAIVTQPPDVADAATRTLHCPADMVFVPAGAFRMGSPEGEGDRDEHPAHEVTLSAYCIDRTEVTVKAYTACVRAGTCTPAAPGVDCDGQRPDRQDHPVNCVDWNQAAAYCASGERRLPTEAEWEYAARGSDGRKYPWGPESPSAERLNACGLECTTNAHPNPMYYGRDGWEATAPVGSFPAGASPFGVLDMAGNVWEWTADWYGEYQKEAVTNPRGAETGTARVIRGGAWFNDDARLVRATHRIGDEPTVHINSVGFRCARGY